MYFSKRKQNQLLFTATLYFLLFIPLFAGIPGYYFQELLYNFAGEDSVLVNSREYNGEDGGNQNRPYGMVIDPDGKQWIGFYSGFSNEFVRVSGDTLQLTGIRCFLPDGSEAAFSPIEFLLFEDGSRDTLYEGSTYNGACRGLSLSEDGNILYTARSTLYKIDYHDGSGITRWHPGMNDKPIRTFVKAAHDPVSAYIYLAPYASQEEVHILDENLQYVGTAVSSTPTLQNAMIARTKLDGVTQLFSATHSNGQGIFVYESENPGTEPFVLVDTIGNYSEETDTNTIYYTAWPSSIDWLERDEGIIIFGNDYRAITSVSSGTPPPSSHASRWVILDVDTDSIIAMFGAPWYENITGTPQAKDVTASVPEEYLENHVMSMRPGGATTIINGDHYSFVLTDWALNCVQLASFSTAVPESRYIPFSFTLDQNYPNPFNPITNIQFNIGYAENIDIDILDIKGKKISEIFSGYLEAGTHNIVFDASGLSSGIYLYRLRTRSLSVTRKMIFLK